MRIISILADLLICVVFLGLAAGPAAANMRAPMQHHSPSTALATPGAGLTVLSETLDFSCDQQGCRVRARYVLMAKNSGNWSMAFVLSEPGDVVVRNGDGAIIRSSSRPTDWNDPLPKPDRRGKSPLLHYMPNMHAAAFQISLPQGESVIDISYSQAWGKAERKFAGYFTGWLSARTLRYELWPLRQWSMAPDFRLKVRLRVSDDEAKAVLLRAAGRTNEGFGNLETLTPESGGVFSSSVEWGSDFPARLELVVGAEEAMSTYGVKPAKESRNSRREYGPDDF